MLGNEVHFVGADDAHGAPIMIAAENAGKTPEQFVNEIAAGASSISTASTSPSITGIRHIRPRTPSCRRKSIKNCATTPTHLHKIGRAVLRSGQRHVPRRPLHQRRMPEMRRQDQYGDACEVCSSVYAPTDLKNPYSTLSGATPVMKSSEHFFFKLSDPKCTAFLKEWINKPGRLQSQVANKAKEWLEGEGDKSLGDWDISATRLTSASRSRMRRANIFTCGWMRRSATSPASKRIAKKPASISTRSWPIPRPNKSILSARTLFISTRCSGRQC